MRMDILYDNQKIYLVAIVEMLMFEVVETNN